MLCMMRALRGHLACLLGACVCACVRASVHIQAAEVVEGWGGVGDGEGEC